MSDAVQVVCHPCVVCGKQSTITVRASGLTMWQVGEHIQNALPELSDAERELLISGTCGPCFDELFAEN